MTHAPTIEIAEQAIVLRKDLNTHKGKMVAQAAHASLTAILREKYEPAKNLEAGGDRLLSSLADDLRSWLCGDLRKICVGVSSEAELLAVFAQGKESGLRCSLIQDHCLTEFGGVPTDMAVAIGPAHAGLIDAITEALVLL